MNDMYCVHHYRVGFDVCPKCPFGVPVPPEPTEAELWVRYVRRMTTTSHPTKFKDGRRRVSVRDAALARRLADLLEADIEGRIEYRDD